jgi:hypothetical protein
MAVGKSIRICIGGVETEGRGTGAGGEQEEERGGKWFFGRDFRIINDS